MDQEQFFTSLENDDTLPPQISLKLQALWLAQKDRWDAAHDLCDKITDTDGAWIHAYLHRVEGDLPNASYWYSQAGRKTPQASVSLHSEWLGLVAAFCESND